MNLSLFHLYSYGIIAENMAMANDDGSLCKEVLVTPIEVLTMLDGEIKSNPTKQTIQGTDASGRNYTVSAIHDNVLVAEWLNVAGDNRVTPPNVRRGERVKIWRYGDTDKFYWSSTGQDNHLRKLETVAHAWSGTTDEHDTKLTDANSYYSEVSTHKKTVTFSTSKKNGEVAGYKVQIDAGRGYVHIQDDAGQVFELDTLNNRMSMTNAQGSQVRIDGQNIAMTCKDTLSAAATNSIRMKAKQVSVECETLEVSASDSITLKASNQFTADSPKTTVTGDLQVGGTTTFDKLVTASEGLNSPSVPIHGPSETLS